jgi:hypothetical protein
MPAGPAQRRIFSLVLLGASLKYCSVSRITQNTSIPSENVKEMEKHFEQTLKVPENQYCEEAERYVDIAPISPSHQTQAIHSAENPTDNDQVNHSVST